MIDLNVCLGPWPFAMKWDGSPETVSRHLADAGVTRAHASSIEAVLAPNPIDANEKLCQQVEPIDLLAPAIVVNPMLPAAHADLSRLLDRWPIRLIKLYPNYHRYHADHDRVVEIIQAAAQRNVRTAVVVRHIDDRNQPTLLPIPATPTDDVIRLAGKVQPTPLLMLNGVRNEAAAVLSRTGNVTADIAFVESGSSIGVMLKGTPHDRLVFGSNAPFFYPQAAAAKLANPDLTDDQRHAIAATNADALLQNSRPNA